MIKITILKFRLAIVCGVKFKNCLLQFFMIGSLLQGCSILGKNYVKPNTQVPKKWPQQTALVKIDDRIDLPDLAWWRQSK